MTEATRVAAVAAALVLCAAQVSAQHEHAHTQDTTTHAPMWMLRSGNGWALMGMAQVFPTITLAAPTEQNSPLERRGLYATQPAMMFNIEAPGSVLVLRTTLNFEGITQPGGELTYGGWGEGFIDKRHPHTLLHEFMLSMNVLRAEGASASLSVGKGFAPYGTDDPMSRPVLKYPTNHHLSQILERWTLNGVVATASWSVEGGLFSGNEPTGPYDLGNTEDFGQSWSARVARRFGAGVGSTRAWEVSASVGSVRETHHDEATRTMLFNAAVRHEQDHRFGRLYGLAEFSRSDPEHGDGYYAAVLEASLLNAGRLPYFRVEYATRPEYAREGGPDTDGFFRYDHDSEPVGATKWAIVSAGFGWNLTNLPISVRPYAEAQYHAVWRERGTIRPEVLYGRSRFWAFSTGARIFLGGEPMRMGAYGVLDPMTRMHQGSQTPTSSLELHHH